jgi:two-component system, NtrC family, sensor kinase
LKRDLAALKNQILHDHKLVSVGQLAGGVSHEINNPLAIIASETGLIKDMLNPDMGLENSPDAIIKELNEIEKATYRAKSITGKLLSFFRKRNPETVPCNVEQLVEEVLGCFVEQELKVSNVTVRRDYSPDIQLLMLDPDLISQVFLNLINNARDAVSDGGMISLKTFLDGDQLKITVADTGSGIAEEELEKVFMPFYTTKRAGSGTGLGLSISLKIIEVFGGTIDVNSSIGKGSAFTIVLPVSKLSVSS